MTGIDDPDTALLGYMISYETWEKYIWVSTGSDRMKQTVITYVLEHVPMDKDGLIDSFKLGLALGTLLEKLRADVIKLSLEVEIDWSNTIVLTRNLDNVPFVRRKGEPVS